MNGLTLPLDHRSFRAVGRIFLVGGGRGVAATERARSRDGALDGVALYQPDPPQRHSRSVPLSRFVPCCVLPPCA